MPQSLWTSFLLLLLLIVLVLTEASKKGGKNKGGNWNSNRYPNQPSGGSWSGWNQGNTRQNWGHNYNPSGGNTYNNKQWKPPKPKSNMKMVAAGAAAGAIGGFMLGNAVGNMRYNFDNDREYNYYNNYRNQMPNQVYRPMYGNDMHVSQDSRLKVRMANNIVFFCLLCLLLVDHSMLSPPRRASKKPAKGSDSKGVSKPKISSPANQHPGQLSFGDYDDFLTNCLNTTMEQNKAWVDKRREEEDVYMSVGMHVLKFICSENYGKSPNRANLFSGGLLITTIGVLVSFAMQGLG
uniref:Prion protein n=1 Tax=Leptobrachium leishanense TaxID=445787 RepID=A0A8C5PAZ1_9ANUR